MKIVAQLLLSFVLFYNNLISESYDAQINIELIHDNHKISEFYNGGFIEMVHDFVNGYLGFAAQELQNRGFDLPEYETGISRYWYMYFEDKFSIHYLDNKDMVNRNGVYSQAIVNLYENNLSGISQETYISDAGCDFYIYMKSKDSLNVNIRIVDLVDNKKVLYEKSLGNPDTLWRKYEMSIPAGLNIHKSKLIIYFNEKGTLLLDEASLLPKDHVNQVRREYYELYKKWKPRIIRFPGGTVADEYAAHWEYGIGDIDQRKSPNLYTGEIQRFEVGVDEFIDFCKNIGAEPQFVTNMKLGSPEESANLVEYLNSDTNTYWGKKRAENGYIEPFKIKYFEIGNEQWDYPDSNAIKFKLHATEMLKVDSSIHLIFGGNLWDYQNFYDISVDIAGDYFNTYGWHYLHFADIEKLPDTIVYKAMMAGYQGNQKFIDMFRDWRIKKKKYDMKLAVTELWTAYKGIDWFHTDRLFSLESGLWTADHIMQAYENNDLMNIINHTSNSGVFERGYVNGQRIIKGSPTFSAIQMLTDHSGEYFHLTTVDAPTFDIEHENLLWAEYNVPWLRCTVTSDRDSMYIAVINKHPELTCELSHNLKLLEETEVIQYELFSENYNDRNEINSSNVIEPIKSRIKSDNSFNVKKNSFNIFVLPLKSLLSSVEVDSSFRVYPNPAFDYLKIKDLKPHNYTITIYDTNGKIVLKEYSLTQEILEINIKKIISGVYYVLIDNNKGIKTYRKFIKN